MFTVYSANILGDPENVLYPHTHVINSEADLKEAVRHDYVCAEYKYSHRLNDYFVGSDCLPVDCDNDHSEKEADWITPKDVAAAFPGVSFVAHYSRHNMKPKGEKSARPRFHILFEIDRMTDPEAYKAVKTRINGMFPYFDKKALDAARFFYGTKNPEIEFVHGSMTLTQFLNEEEEFDREMGKGTYGASPINEGSRNSTMSRFAGRVLKRFENTPEARAIFDERAASCNPPLPDRELETIWKSAVRFWEKISKEPGYIPAKKYNGEPKWEEPIPFEEYDLPDFPVDALPKPIADYVAALSESTQTPVDMAATAAIAVMSVCMQGKYMIRAKPDWTEPVNTFVLDVMDPSERKSAVENAMIRPLNAFEAEQNRQNAAAIESSKMQKRILERRQKAIEDQVAKGKADEEEIARIAEEIAEFEEAKPLKLYVDDITTEKLVSVLSDNDGRAAILSTEGGIFDTLAGTYSKNVNIDVMLKGYSGDCIRVDRIGRNSESIMNPALTILLMVQPSVLSGLMQNDTFRGRGLTSRFLYCVPKSSVGKRKYRSASVPYEVYQNYERCIRNMLEDEYKAQPEIITLSAEADKMIEGFAEELEPKLKESYEEFSDWAGKLVGNVLRISALLCRASVYRSHEFLDVPEVLSVDKNTMENAIRIGNYFIRHAKVAYVIMGVEPDAGRCRRVIDAVKKNGLTEFNRRDIMRLCRTFKKAEDVQRTLDQLQDYGYISPKEQIKYSGKGRPPAQIYRVNPLIYEE